MAVIIQRATSDKRLRPTHFRNLYDYPAIKSAYTAVQLLKIRYQDSRSHSSLVTTCLFVARVSTTITINIIKEWRSPDWSSSLSLIRYIAYFLYMWKLITIWQRFQRYELAVISYHGRVSSSTRRNFSIIFQRLYRLYLHKKSIHGYTRRNSNDEEESLTELCVERGSKIEFTTFRPAEFWPKARRSGSQQVFTCIFYHLLAWKRIFYHGADKESIPN